ncbi:MAG: TQO small subunit DoxD, partial [Candidatus Limnocylindrales bacterium]
MLPLRLFLGGTFVYAGLDKLWFDPSFLASSAPTSLAAQLAGFAHTSPLAPLIVVLGEPLAVPLGVLIALAEIAIGLGALTGLLARLCAWGGVAMATLLWLTASWAVHPYYLGPDLPYLAGWLTLALVGDGGIFSLAGVVRRWGIARGWLDGPGRPMLPPAWAAEAQAADLERRRFLEGALLAALAV